VGGWAGRRAARLCANVGWVNEWQCGSSSSSSSSSRTAALYIMMFRTTPWN
jgi:hypothetical protein